jgi:type II secretion system protein J
MKLISPTLAAQPSRRDLTAFTLMEVMLAAAVSAITLAAIGGVFYSAIRLRERTVALLDQTAPLYQAVGFLRRDLAGAVQPGGTLSGDFRGGMISSGTFQGQGLQFSTTTGIIRDTAPWGDLQQVTYQLRDPAIRTAGGGKELIRSLNRNLLSTLDQEPVDQFLMGNISKFEFSCFDGSNWRDTWDTSVSDTNLPTAVKISIQFAGNTSGDLQNDSAMEIIVPLVSQSRTNLVAATNSATQ